MSTIASIRLHITLAALLALRTMIAPGYMPGGDGWPVRLCPDGLDGTTVALLLGDDHRHHGRDHAGHGKTAHGNPDEPQPHAGWSLERCALGASLAQAALPCDSAVPLQLQPSFISRALPVQADPGLRIERPRARSPPVRFVLQAIAA